MWVDGVLAYDSSNELAWRSGGSVDATRGCRALSLDGVGAAKPPKKSAQLGRFLSAGATEGPVTPHAPESRRSRGQRIGRVFCQLDAFAATLVHTEKTSEEA